MTTPRKFETVIWCNIQLSVPADWEMLQFSRNPTQGRCAFADRYQFRLELNWRKVAGPPDFERMLSDYSAKLESDGLSAGQRMKHQDWQGLESTTPDCPLASRWGRYFETSKTLVELVFLWPQDKDKSIESAVLESVIDSPSCPEDAQRWRAFGMDLLASRDLNLVHCDTRPAHVEWLFQHAKTSSKEMFSRRGMVSEWLNQPLADWLQETVGSQTVGQKTATTVGGHAITTLIGTERVSMLPPRKNHIAAAAWICPRDGRLYSVISKSKSVRSGRLHALTCCPELST